MNGQRHAKPTACIGLLDSGVGGLSVLRDIHCLLPQYPTIYFADQAHLPYGPRPAAEIQHFVSKIADFLIEQGAAVIVIACNSASAASLDYLRQRHPDIPFVGMEPAVKPAVELTQTGVIGVLTTRATAEGPLYQRVLARYAGNVRVMTQIAPELVQIVEQGSQNTAHNREVISACVGPFIQANVDQVALACTHFPFLIPVLQDIMGVGVHLIDPSPAIARQVGRVMPDHLPIVAQENRYFTSGSAEQFRQMLRKLVQIEGLVTGAIELTL